MSEEILFKEKLTLLHKVLALIVIIIVVNVASFIIEPIIYLSENQILYLMSTSAQVMAGLFGIVLTAYAIIDPKLQSQAQNNEDAEESLKIIRKEYHDNIVALSILCAFTIISCLITLGCFEDISESIVSMLLNQSSILCVGSIVLILSFGCSLLNPNSLSKLNSRALNDVHNEYKEENLKYEPFVEVYNKLQYLLITYALELERKDFDNSIGENNIQQREMHINQALKILQMNNIIDKNIYVKINELRRYRNALVHSGEHEKVSLEIYDNLQEIYNLILAIYEQRDSDDESVKKKEELNELGKRLSKDQKEKAILDLINKNANITLKELSDELAYTPVTIKRIVHEMCNKGRLVNENGQYKVVWEKQNDITDKE